MEINKPLKLSEIDFRIQSINKGKYATILVYKDARVDMNRLDDVYGVGNWQRKHEVINGNLFCSVGVWHDKSKTWAWVQDCGTESSAEKEKGQASDSFKRACFNLGIGRELYDYPVISVKLLDNEVQEFNGKFKQSFGLKLKEWMWACQRNENGALIYLAAKDQNNSKRFEWGKAQPVEKFPIEVSKIK